MSNGNASQGPGKAPPEPISEEHQRALLKEPGLFQKAANLAGTVKDVAIHAVTDQTIQVPKTKAEERIAICKACSFYLAPREVCGVCGCNMPFKTRLAAGKCPKGKW